LKEYVFLTVAPRNELAAIAICLEGPIGIDGCGLAGFSLWDKISFFMTGEYTDVRRGRY
jgi:hypothetical protein